MANKPNRQPAAPPADNFFDALNGLEWEYYYYIQCRVPWCQGVYRLGRYGFEEGATNCPYCGVMSWTPNLVDKATYRAFLEKQKNPKGIDAFQRAVWGRPTEKGTDEEYQRR